MKITYRVHAVRRKFERGITEADVGKVLSGGEQIATYRDDTPYPSRLLLGGEANGRCTWWPPIMLRMPNRL